MIFERYNPLFYSAMVLVAVLVRFFSYCFLLAVMPGALSVEMNPLNAQHLRVMTMEVSIQFILFLLIN